LRVPARRFLLLWAAVVVASVLTSEVLAWLTAPVQLALSVTAGLLGMLVLIRRQEAGVAARWPLGEQRRAAAPWN
jgi:hypothetical protein